MRRVRDVGQSGALQGERLVDRLFRNRKRLAQHAQRFELPRHLHDVLLAIHDALGLVAVKTPDSALAILAGPAHVGPVHAARRALAAAPADGENREIAALHARDRVACGNDLAQHFVADDKIGLPGRGKRATPRGFLAIGPADADTHDVHLHLVGRADRRLGPIGPAQRGRTGYDCYCFHRSFVGAAPRALPASPWHRLQSARKERRAGGD